MVQCAGLPAPPSSELLLAMISAEAGALKFQLMPRFKQGLDMLRGLDVESVYWLQVPVRLLAHIRG